MSEEGAAAPRADPLAYPTPTTAQYVILVLALLAGGLYIGSWVHNLLVGGVWLEEAARCLASTAELSVTPSSAPSALEERRAHAMCMARVEERRAVYAFTGAVVTLAAGVGTMVAVPSVLERRRGLRPLPVRLAGTLSRAEELAREAGLRRPPAIRLGRSTQRDAFSYGYPGHYRIVLPAKAALRPGDARTFDPLLRHELAHVRRHDVALAWLARSVWYAFLPLLLVPVVISAAREDLSVTLDYVWRAAVVLVTVRLVADAVLRAREHDADLAAARGAENRRRIRYLLAGVESGPAAARLATVPATWARRTWTSLRAQHPTAARRIEVLDDPTSALHPSVADAVTAAFLAATAGPLIESSTATGLTGSGGVTLAGVIAAVLSGSLMGVAVGLGTWRAALYHRLTRRPLRPMRIALGVGAGFALGRALSLGQVGTASGVGVDNPAVLVVPMLVGVGASAVVTGLGLLWADAAPRLPSVRWHWVTALVTSGAVFGAAVWTSEAIVDTLDWGGLRFTVLSLASAEPSWLVLAAAVAAGSAAWAALALRRLGARAPAWAVEGPPRPGWPVPSGPGLAPALVLGACTGAAGTLALLAFRLSYGSPTTTQEVQARVVGYVLVVAGTGVAAATAAALVSGLRGAGASFVVAGSAVVAGATGLVGTNVALGGALAPDLLGPFLLRPASIAAMLCLLVAGAALPRSRSAADAPPDDAGDAAPRRFARSASASFLVAVVLTLALAGPVLGERHRIADAALPVASEEGALARRAAARVYVQTVVLPFVERFEEAARTADAINAAPRLDPARRAELVRGQVAPHFEAMLRFARGYHAPSTEVAEVHALAIDALTSFAAATSSVAEALERQDSSAAEEARRRLAEAVATRTEWLRRVVELEES